MRWLTDIRKIALLACITSVASLGLPLWNAAQGFMGIASQVPPEIVRVLPISVLTFLLSALLPTFYFALYRDQGPLQVSERLRFLARTAAFIGGILLVFELAEWAESPVHLLSDLLGTLATVANIILLAALSFDSGGEWEEVPVSSLLYVVTKITVITWGAWVAFQLLRVVLLPYTYSQLRNYALSVGSEGPALADLTKEAVHTFLSQAILLAAPYIVFRSRVRQASAPTGTAVASPDLQIPPPS